MHAANKGDEVVIPLHPCLQYRIAVLTILIRDPLYDCPQLHNDVTKVRKLLGNQENNCTFLRLTWKNYLLLTDLRSMLASVFMMLC